MSKSKIDFKGDITNFQKFLTPNVLNGNLEREIRKATIRNSLFLIKKVKESINKGFTENSQMTLALKKSDKPLVDQTNLWNAIDHRLKSSFESEVGVFRQQSSTGGKLGKSSKLNMQHLVELMEEGYTIKVTTKMRQAMAAKFSEKGLSQDEDAAKKISNGEWVVPPRPLLSIVWGDPAVQKVIRENWQRAIENAFKASGAIGGEHKNHGNDGGSLDSKTTKTKRKYTKKNQEYWSKKGKK